MSAPNLSQLPLVGAVTLMYNPDNPKLIDSSKLRVEPTQGEGDCLYHALANLANHYQHPNAHKFYKRQPVGRAERADSAPVVDVRALRDAVADVLAGDWEWFKALHPELKTVDRETFVKDVRHNRWGGEPELDAALRVFPNVRVAVWARNAQHQTVLHSLATPDEGGFGRTWHILMHGLHYEWMSQRRPPSPPLSLTRRTVAPTVAPTVPIAPIAPTARRSAPRSAQALLREAESLRRQRRELSY